MSNLATFAPQITQAAGLASTGLSAFGQYQESQATASAARYNAQVARTTADLTGQSGELAIQQLRRTGARLKGSQVAGYSAGGVAIGGSALEVIADSASQLEMDVAIEKANTQIKQRTLLATADLELMKARQAKASAFLTPAATVLGGIAKYSFVK